MRDTAFGRFVGQLTAHGRGRRLRAVLPASPGRVTVGGRELVNFSSNDYLGLSRHPELIRRAQEWAAAYGVGSGGSRLVTGTLEVHERIEEKIARGKGSEAALLFPTGYQANVSLLPALLSSEVHGAEPLVFADRLNHASLHDGCRAAGVRQIRYRHRDVGHLEALLKDRAADSRPKFILSESVFSMDGDQADVAALVDMAARYDAFLFLDEAHATGVFGPDGFGFSAAHPGGVDLAMGTFGKALGGFGAYVACSRRVRDYLVNRCAGFVYSTALPPPVLGAIEAALDLIPTLSEVRRSLLAKADEVRAAFQNAGLDCGGSTTPIVPVIVGDDAGTLGLSQDLEDEGMLGVAIRPPTVPEGTSRVRFSLSAVHTGDDVARLTEAVPRLLAGRTRRRGAAS
ncbi:MAG: 8-amino-7-oxononanoate synthase [Alphaproteobacteria bacterium]